jgi:hypothetical protein
MIVPLTLMNRLFRIAPLFLSKRQIYVLFYTLLLLNNFE